MATMDQPQKVVVLGEAGVGKTSLICRFVNNLFTDYHQSTINDIHTKQTTVDGRRITLEIWDTAGCERFHSLSVGFYRGATCCVLVYDVTKPNTFKMLETWRDNFLLVVEARKLDMYQFVVIGNKSDILCRSEIAKRAEQWCASQGDVPHFEASARDATNVDLAFQEVARRAISQLGPPPREPMQRSIRLRHPRHRLDNVNDDKNGEHGWRRLTERRTPCGAVATCDR